jgi:hypothetical protein
MKVNHNAIFKYYQLGVYPSYERVIALGDIHGDFNAFILVLKKAHLIDNDYHWIGGKTHVVQVGDILDRKIRDGEYSDEDSEFKIISLILKLQLESYIDGGGFHPVIGNHELMNILGIFDYVSALGLMHFNGVDGRRDYFKIGGDFCTYLACAWNPIIKIGDYIFCHGGLNMNIAENYSIKDINFIMRDTLYGNTDHLNEKYFNTLFMEQNSILWNRTYSTEQPKTKELTYQKLLDKILKIYDAKYLVIGHSPQNDGIKFRYENKVICIDTAMSKAFGKKRKEFDRIHYLELMQLKGKIIIH